MNNQHRKVIFKRDVNAVDIYQAGRRVPPRNYVPLVGGHEVHLGWEDTLPSA